MNRKGLHEEFEVVVECDVRNIRGNTCSFCIDCARNVQQAHFSSGWLNRCSDLQNSISLDQLYSFNSLSNSLKIDSCLINYVGNKGNFIHTVYSRVELSRVEIKC